MLDKPWLNRLTVFALLTMVYAAGTDMGRTQAITTIQGSSICR
jgi:hypothetical protein